MPFIPAPNCVKIEVVFQQDGKECVNLHHVRLDAPATSREIQDLANAVATWVVDWWATIGGLTTSILYVRTTALDAEDGLQYTVSGFVPGTGAVNSPRLPNNVSLVVKWLTNLSGRSRRGRTFIVGITNDAKLTASPSYAHPDFVEAVRTVYENLMSAISSIGAGAILAVVSYREDNAWRSEALVTAVQSLVVNNRFDTMRKRLPAE